MKPIFVFLYMIFLIQFWVSLWFKNLLIIVGHVLFVRQNIKLSSIKVDTRYTTTQQVVKLIGSHTISKVTVKIGDLKRTKMVRTISLYYNNRTVQAIVELKNKYVSTSACWLLSLPPLLHLELFNNEL